MQSTPSFSREPPAIGDADPPMIMRLYIAGATPNSVRAQANFTAALARSSIGQDHIRQEVVDVFAEPKRARNDGVIITPTLLIFIAGTCVTIIGDLSDTMQLDAQLARAGHRG